jgi:hypothetical protein
MVQLTGGVDCEIMLSVGMVAPPLAVQLPVPADCVPGHIQ